MRALSVRLLVAAAGMAGVARAQQQSVVDSPHNLSAGGTGQIRAASEDQVCIFCHAPHNASPVRPLWNRLMPTEAYSIYTSRALNALPGQPTGTSKMCLSCHDGTIAIGNVISRDLPIVMTGGAGTVTAGHGLIGTDLRDDHPISFRFDGGLAARDQKLKSPSTLPEAVKLDSNMELQCTTCHDPHNNALGSFLVMRNSTSELCTTCHTMGTTTIAAHSDCAACHQPHSAPSGPYLLKRANATQTCNQCHNGTVPTAADIASDLRKFVVHDTNSSVDPAGAPIEHTSCTSCHDPHTMSKGAGVSPSIHPNFGRIGGVNLSGAEVAAAVREYEVCFKCHADGSMIDPHVSRAIVQNNTRLEFATNAVSFHPVSGPGRNPNVPSLKPGWTTASTMYCSSCHQSDTARAIGGSGANGTHGSGITGLLVARNETQDRTTESAAAYALCYQCHDRAQILDDTSFKEHKKHIVNERTPCSACHDAHGVSSLQGNPVNNSNLINFDTRIVFPNRQGRMEFRDTGLFRGECFLSCHGEEHAPERYEP